MSRPALSTLGSVVVLLVLSSLAPASTPAADRPVRTIGISVDGTFEDARWLLELFQSEFRTLMDQEFELRFPEDRILAADYDPEAASRINRRLLDDPDLDLVLALGPTVSADLVARRDLTTPALAPLVLRSIHGELPRGPDGGSGLDLLTYVEPVFDLQHDITRFRELVGFDRLAAIGPAGLMRAVAGLRDGDSVSIASMGLELVAVELRETSELTAAAVPEDIDAVLLLGPAPGAEDRVQDWIEPLHARGLPTFAITGEVAVRRGALAGLTPASWWPRLARRSALVSRRLLMGESAASIPVQMTREETYYINMSTARELGISPTFDLMSEAVLVGEVQREPARVLGLRDVMREAIDRNHDLAALRRRVEAGREDVSIARAVLLPQLDANLAHRWIDEDRAAQATAGAERTLAGTLDLSQVLWSEQAWANLSVQRHLFRALEATLRQQELDVALQATTAYFDVLAAMADERIRKDNLRLTRSNLERARVRERLGAASPAESYRWESQVALDQDALVTSIAQRNLAEIEINRVLDQPLEEKLGLVDIDGPDGLFTIMDPRLLPYIDDPASLRKLRAFASVLAQENSPELAQIDASIAAQMRLRSSATRSFFSPELALQGNLTHSFERSGAGSELFDTSPLDDDDWEIALGLSLPLFEGGRRLAERSQASAEILRLRREREALVQRIEQRVRSAIHVASASFTRIDLTRRSTEASHKNFDLVSDAYARGAVSITELLDAQTAYLTAQQRAASATYRFLSDLMEVERATGSFFVLDPESVHDAIFERLENFVGGPDSTIPSSSKD